MILIEQSRQDYDNLKEELLQIGDALGLVKLKAKKAELELCQAKDDFWGDMENAQQVNTQLARTNEKINHYNKLFSRLEDIEVMILLCMESNSLEEAQDISTAIKHLEIDIEALKLETLLKGKYDANNAILTLHAGAGGTEAQDWTQMLFRMYSRYAERTGYKVAVLDELSGDEAGIKSISFSVIGTNAYG